MDRLSMPGLCGHAARLFVTWLALLLMGVAGQAHAALAVMPSSLSLAANATRTAQISGAQGTIRISVGNTAVAGATLGPVSNGSATLTVTGKGVGSTNITVRDRTKNRVVLPVTVVPMTVSPASLSMVAGTTSTLATNNAAGALAASSSRPAVATVGVSANVVTITGVAAGSATVSVSDGITTVGVAVTVVPRLTVSPTSLAMTPNTSSSITASNVSGTLSASSGNTSVATASVSGNVIAVRALASGATVVTVRDSSTTLTVPVTVASSSSSGRYSLLAWNDLGMHCMDGKDYSIFSILPPFNNLHAQLVNAGTGKAVTSGVTLTYEAVADPTGSNNTSSAGKTNFWNWVQALYGANPAPNIGLTGNATPSTTPKPLTLDAANQWFEATGLPITPYDDVGAKNFYPTVKVVAKDLTGKVLATTITVLPVSDEITCAACHASRPITETNPARLAARPAAGWVNDTNAELDWKKNILRLHDEKQGASSVYVNALATQGMPAGLYASALAGKPTLCASCHGSNALPGTGLAGISMMTSAQHRSHGKVIDPANMLSLDSSTNRSACYSCHPGSVTKCLRGAMGNAVDASGNALMGCQSCHGNMTAVGDPARVGWLQEPTCQACHYNGKRTTSALDSAGKLVVPTDTRFATNANVPLPGTNLFRFSKGHGGMQCEACHGATHAEYPSSHDNDNIQSIALQGYAGTVRECKVCHASSLVSGNGGPHGMHSIGAGWVSEHHDLISSSGGKTACAYCHGADYRGTPLSQAKVTRSYTHDGRTTTIAAGTNVGCYNCHNGPSP
jgi:Pilus formation protein N terminal region